MTFDGSIQGKWSGRLVYVRGFEGDVTLNLKQDRRNGEITSAYDAAIGTNHASSVFHGKSTIKQSKLRPLNRASILRSFRVISVPRSGDLNSWLQIQNTFCPPDSLRS
jgi:hypothetical protein